MLTKKTLRKKIVDLQYSTEDGGKIAGVRLTMGDLETLLLYLDHEGDALLQPYGEVLQVLKQCSDYTLPKSNSWI